MNQANSSQILTAEEVASRWRISARTVREMAAAGELQAFKVRQAWRIPFSSVIEYEEGKPKKDPGMPRPVVTKIT